MRGSTYSPADSDNAYVTMAHIVTREVGHYWLQVTAKNVWPPAFCRGAARPLLIDDPSTSETNLK